MEERRKEMFRMRTEGEWEAYFAEIGFQRYAKMGTPTEEDGEEEDVVVDGCVEEVEVVEEAVEVQNEVQGDQEEEIEVIDVDVEEEVEVINVEDSE